MALEADKGRSKGPSHRDYVLERARRIAEMFSDLKESDSLRDKFHEEPDVVGARYGVSFTDEEVFGIRAMKSIALANLQERLSINPVAVFDANCSCAIFGRGGELVNPASRK
jgi:hypothetical protein